LEEDHALKLTEMKQASEIQLKELTNQQGKQILALEASEKEIKSLKDEVKVLKVICNFQKTLIGSTLVCHQSVNISLLSGN